MRMELHVADALSPNVQRFATRRQARTVLGHAPLNSSHPFTCPRAISAVYSGAHRRCAEARTDGMDSSPEAAPTCQKERGPKGQYDEGGVR